MLNKIIHYSLHNRLVVVCAAILLLIAETYTAMHTEVDVFPDLNAPTVVIMTEANGMAAEEVEQLVTFPVETAVNGATGVRRVRSFSTNGFSVVLVEFDWGTDIYLARQIVSEKLAVVSESLPVNVGKPTLGPQSSILGEMLIVGLTADSTSMLDLRTIADWTIRPRLLSTGGVAQVAVLGGDIKEYQIQLDPERMRHYGISMGEVMAVTQDMNLNANGGVLYEFGNEYIVRGVLSTSKTEQLGKAVVKTVNNFPVAGRYCKRNHRPEGSETGYCFRTRQICRPDDCYQATGYQHTGTDGQTGSISERPPEKSAAGRKSFNGHIPSKPLYRKLHRQCEKITL